MFTLRNIAFFLCAGLVFALVTSQLRIAALESEINLLRATIGFEQDYSPDEDVYIISEMGDSTTYDSSPTYFLRVENYQDYQLEVVHYGNSVSEVRHFEIMDPIVAISFFPESEHSNLFIRSTFAQNLNTFHSVRIETGPLIKHSNHGRFGESIEDNMILTFFFGASDFEIPFGKPEFNWRHPITLEKLKRLCDTCKIEAITFRLVKTEKSSENNG